MTTQSLTPSQWAAVSAEFPELEAASAAERAQRLATLQAADPAVAAELRSLLAASDADDGTLDRVAQDALADWQSTRGPSLLGRTVGPWTVTGEIGRGGMGVVYEGVRTDGEFTMRVAIKTLAMAVQQPELVWRFRRERRILADLSHPNITALFDGGATELGVPYLVMEYVDGVRIDTWCDEQRLDVRARLDLFRTVCAAVQFAHSKLVVHRDLKPSNILVTRDGVVKLLDFGVAKLMAADDRDADTTRTGFGPLTTAYASPEQARGEAITTATDVYALGVLLFRLLTGRAPYELDRATAAEAMQIVSETTPRLPSEIAATDSARAALRGELDAIVMMALRKDPSRRYGTVQALSDDVLRYLKREPVSARPERLAYTVRSFVRRKRAFSIAVGVALLSMIAGTGASLWEARIAEQEARRATRVRTMLESVLSASDPFSYNGIRVGGTDVPLRVVLDSAVRRVAASLPDDPHTRADLYRSFASSYRNLDEPIRAAVLADSARLLHEQTAGPESLDVVADLFIAAGVRRSLGDVDSALVIMEQVWARADRNTVARDSLGSLVLLGIAQLRQELFFDVDSVRLPSEQAIGMENARVTPRQPIVAVAEGLLASVETMRGQVARSDSLIARATQRLSSDSLSFPTTPMYVYAYAGYATFLRGALPVSEGYWRRALRTSSRVFGSQHPLTAESQSGLSATLLGLGRIAEGKALADSALATELARTHRNDGQRAGLYRLQMSYAIAMGDTAAAVAAQAQSEAALPGTGRRRPFLDMYLSFASAALAMQQRDTTTAWHALARAERVMREGPGPSHPLTAMAGARLAEFSTRMGRDARTGAPVGTRE